MNKVLWMKSDHVWKKDDKGNIEQPKKGEHYGPVCEACNYTFCIGCDVLCEEECPGMGDAEIPEDRILRGQGVSKGTFTGRAVVLDSPDARIMTLSKEDVLVCHETNPDWAEAFERVGAVVTEVGSLLCHAALVCRENKLPCVVNIKKARKVIPQGATIRVDGKLGEVEIT